MMIMYAIIVILKSKTSPKPLSISLIIIKKGETELVIILEVINFKKSATSEINKLQTNIGDGCNKTLATSKLETIIDNLEQHVDSLRNLNVKNLSPNLKTIRNVLIQGINDSIKKVKTFIENL